MPWEFIGYRLRYYWRHFLLLLAVMSLTGAFFALEPLYANTLSEGFLRRELDQATARDFQLSFRNVDTPINEALLTSLNNTMGDTLASINPISRSEGIICKVGVREEDHCHQIISYENYTDILRLVEGRLPEVVTPEDDADSVSFEVTITPTVADIIGLAIGDVVVFSEGNITETRFRIVGFMEAIAPERPFWDFEGTFLEGTRTPFGTSFRRDYSVFVLPEVYQETIIPLLALEDISSVYNWRVQAEVSEITAPELRQQTAGFKQLQQDFNQFHPEGTITGTLIPLLNDLRDEIIITETPILMIALLMVVVMLVQVFYLATRFLDAESTEWDLLSQRGATSRQLLLSYLLTVGMVGLISAIIAPILALIALRGFDAVGLLTTTFDNTDVAGTAFPIESVYASVGVAGMCIAVCGLALWVRFSQAENSESPAESQPFFLRYYLDIGVLGFGLLLLLRLYILTSGDINGSLDTLFNNPQQLTKDLALQANNDILTDPFNLIAPIIVMIGLAMVSLRIIPIIVQSLGWVSGRFNNLSLPLPLWTSGRGLKSQGLMLVLLATTLGFGATAYALATTQDNGAWEQAQLQTGDTVNITLDHSVGDITQDWESLPNVTHQTIVLNETANVVINDITDLTRLVSIIGIDETSFSTHFPDYADLMTDLQFAEGFTLAGMPLPENADMFSLQLYSSANGDTEATQVMLTANLRDANGIPFEIELETDDPFNVGSFITYSAQLPVSINPPLRLVSFTLNTERGDIREFDHRIFIDDVTVTTSGGESVMLADFETSAISDWQQQPDWRVVNRASERPVIVRNRSIKFNGETSLQIDYQVRWAGGRLLSTGIPIAGAPFEPLPIVISTELASYIGSGSSARQPLEVGNRGEMTFRFGEDVVSFDYILVGILDTFPSRADGKRFFVAPMEALRHYLNWTMTSEQYFDRNQVWLGLESRQASSDVEMTIADIDGLETVDYAWTHYQAFTSNPLTNAIAGVFYIGFCFGLTTLILIIVFDNYVRGDDEGQSAQILVMLGWSNARLRWWFIGQRIIPIMLMAIISIGLGISLAYLLLPFLELITYEALSIPIMRYLWLVIGVIIGGIGLLFMVSLSAVRTSASTNLTQE